MTHGPERSNRGGNAPLWNREYPVSTFVPYKSPTMDVKSQQPSGTSLACLSCHDGTIAVDRVLKPPAHYQAGRESSLHMKLARGGGTDRCSQCHRAGAENITGIHDLGIAGFGQTLNDDHPVSINYPLKRQDPQFRTRPADDVFGNGVKLFEGRVECASSGADALARAGKASFDLVLTDIQMPGMSGFELIRGLRALTPPPRVAVMSMQASPQHRAAALRMGAEDCMAKHELGTLMPQLIASMAEDFGS